MKIISFFLLSTLTIYRAACYSYNICHMDYSPVCASDGKTYSNKCLMLAENKKLTVLYQGPCNKGMLLSPLKNFENFNQEQENEVHPLNNPKYTNVKNNHLTYTPNNQYFNHNSQQFEQKFVNIKPNLEDNKETPVQKQDFYFSFKNELNYATNDDKKQQLSYKKNQLRDKKNHPNVYSSINTNLPYKSNHVNSYQFLPDSLVESYKPNNSPYKPDNSPYKPDNSPYKTDNSPYKPDNSPYKPDNSPYKPYHSVYKPGRSLYKPYPFFHTATSPYKPKLPHEQGFLSYKPGRSTYTIQLEHEHHKHHHHEKDNGISSLKPYLPNTPNRSDCSSYKSNYMIDLLRRLLGLVKVLVNQHKTEISPSKPKCFPYGTNNRCTLNTNSFLGIGPLPDPSNDVLNKPDDKKSAESYGNTSSGEKPTKPSLEKEKLTLEKKKEASYKRKIFLDKNSNSTTSTRNHGEPKDWGILADYFFDK